MTQPMHVFDRRSVRLHRDRAAGRLDEHDFLLREVGERLVDRLDDVRRRFPVALDLGCHRGELAPLLAGRGGIETLVQCDLSAAMVGAARRPARRRRRGGAAVRRRPFDLVISLLSLHWVNDLPGALRANPPRAEAGRAVAGGAARRRDAEGAAPRAGRGRDRRRRRAQPARLAVRRCPRRRQPAAARRLRPAGGRQRHDHRVLRRSAAGCSPTCAAWARATPSLERARRRAAGRRCSTRCERYRDALRRCRRTGSGDLPGDLSRSPGRPTPRSRKPLRPGSALARLADALGSRGILRRAERARP